MVQKCFKKIFREYGIVVTLLVVMLIITILIPSFMSLSNLVSVLKQSSIFGIMALGMTFIIISGGIDLSAGSVVAFAAVVGASFGQNLDAANKIFPNIPEMGAVLPIVFALLAGALCGFVNGFLIAKAKLYPFIATLGTYTIFRGLALVITEGKPVTDLIAVYKFIGGDLFNVLPVPILIFALAIFLCSILLNQRRFGANTYTIGGNMVAARVAGINISKELIKIYTLAGLLYGAAAVVYTGRVLSVNPGAAEGYELTAIAASIIGGTSPTGGKGKIWGAVIGALILSVIRNGLTLLAVDTYWQQIVEGIIIIVAVILAMRKK